MRVTVINQIIVDVLCPHGENMAGAENQQERLESCWIAGFVDGEGCFHVAINKQPKMTLGYQVLPEFRVVQHKRDMDILERMRMSLGVGRIKRNHGDRFELRVRGSKELNRIVEFFDAYPLQTKKRQDFELFKEIIFLMNDKKHLTHEGLHEIAEKASLMNRQVRSKYLESPETIRRTSLRMKI